MARVALHPAPDPGHRQRACGRPISASNPLIRLIQGIVRSKSCRAWLEKQADKIVGDRGRPFLRRALAAQNWVCVGRRALQHPTATLFPGTIFRRCPRLPGAGGARRNGGGLREIQPRVVRVQQAEHAAASSTSGLPAACQGDSEYSPRLPARRRVGSQARGAGATSAAASVLRPPGRLAQERMNVGRVPNKTSPFSRDVRAPDGPAVFIPFPACAVNISLRKGRTRQAQPVPLREGDGDGGMVHAADKIMGAVIGSDQVGQAPTPCFSFFPVQAASRQQGGQFLSGYPVSLSASVTNGVSRFVPRRRASLGMMRAAFRTMASTSLSICASFIDGIGEL